jgi:Leucine-rich repeat (LRR) protein
VTTASPVSQIALAIVANLRSNPNSAYATTLLTALLSKQAVDGSWGEDIFATGLALRAVAAGAGKDLTAQKQVVNIPDNALRAAINAALGQGAMDAISVGQMQQLTSLNASGLHISDLTGLQCATNLTYLDLSNNNINSFALLAGLTKTTIIESGNPGYVVASNGDNDVPTLPEWGAILLAGLLLTVVLKKSNQVQGYRS